MQCNQPQAHPDRCNCADSRAIADPSLVSSRYPQVAELLGRFSLISFTINRSAGSSIGTKFTGPDAIFHLKTIIESAIDGTLVAANRDRPEAITERHPPVAVNNPEYARLIIQQATSSKGVPTLNMEIDRLGNRASTAIARALYSLTTERNELQKTLKRYNGCYTAETINPLVRELDVLLNGEEGAAPQAMLCDLVAQVRRQGLQVRQDPVVINQSKDTSDYYAKLEAAQSANDYDDVLLPFVELMRRELVKNGHKGSRTEWRSSDWLNLMRGVYDSAMRLTVDMAQSKGDDIARSAAGVANYAMLIADMCGSLDLVTPGMPFGYTPRVVQPVDLTPKEPELWESYEEYDACTPKDPLKTLVEAERAIGDGSCKCIRYGKGNPNWPCELHPDAVAEVAELERAVSEIYGAAQVNYDPEGTLNRIGEEFAGDFTKSFVEPAPIIPIHDHSGED